jgi:hypothetical protein
MDPDFVPPSAALFTEPDAGPLGPAGTIPPPMKQPPPPAAPRTALTADEQIRAKALELAVQFTSDGVLVSPFNLADEFAAYIRGDAR